MSVPIPDESMNSTADMSRRIDVAGDRAALAKVDVSIDDNQLAVDASTQGERPAKHNDIAVVRFADGRFASDLACCGVFDDCGEASFNCSGQTRSGNGVLLSGGDRDSCENESGRKEKTHA